MAANVPKLAPPPGRGGSTVRPDDVTVQLQMMGLADTDAQKPLPQEMVEWGPEPDDLDAELAMVEKELAQLNTLDLSYGGTAESEVVQAEGDYEVWKVQQEKALLEFDPFPDYTKLPDMAPPPAAPYQSPPISPGPGVDARFSSYGALAADTQALTFNQPPSAQSAAGSRGAQPQGAWLEFESPFAASVEPSPAPAVQSQPSAPAASTDGAAGNLQLRAVFQFVPRHADELALNVGDPVVIQSKAPDQWCSGRNLRTGQTGIFPASCVSLPGGAANPAAKQLQAAAGQATRRKRGAKFRLRFVGAVQVKRHSGVDLLCAAIAKVHNWRRRADIGPLKPVILEITAQGIKMTDISDRDARYQEERRESIRRNKPVRDPDEGAGKDKQFFFPLANVTFCSCHPNNTRLWAFVVKRKDRQFTCQVFVASQSTQPLTVAMGRAFKQLHASFISHAYPTHEHYQE